MKFDKITENWPEDSNQKTEEKTQCVFLNFILRDSVFCLYPKKRKFIETKVTTINCRVLTTNEIVKASGQYPQAFSKANSQTETNLPFITKILHFITRTRHYTT